MKRFHVFIGADYYPAAFLDYKASFETLEEAREYADSKRDDWSDIIESTPEGLVSVEYRRA